MEYHRSDFEEETYFRRHPHVTQLIWSVSILIIVSVLAYFGGIEYLITDWFK